METKKTLTMSDYQNWYNSFNPSRVIKCDVMGGAYDSILLMMSKNKILFVSSQNETNELVVEEIVFDMDYILDAILPLESSYEDLGKGLRIYYDIGRNDWDNVISNPNCGHFFGMVFFHQGYNTYNSFKFKKTDVPTYNEFVRSIMDTIIKISDYFGLENGMFGELHFADHQGNIRMVKLEDKCLTQLYESLKDNEFFVEGNSLEYVVKINGEWSGVDIKTKAIQQNKELTSGWKWVNTTNGEESELYAEKEDCYEAMLRAATETLRISNDYDTVQENIETFNNIDINTNRNEISVYLETENQPTKTYQPTRYKMVEVK